MGSQLVITNPAGPRTCASLISPTSYPPVVLKMTPCGPFVAIIRSNHVTCTPITHVHWPAAQRFHSKSIAYLLRPLDCDSDAQRERTRHEILGTRRPTHYLSIFAGHRLRPFETNYMSREATDGWATNHRTMTNEQELHNRRLFCFHSLPASLPYGTPSLTVKGHSAQCADLCLGRETVEPLSATFVEYHFPSSQWARDLSMNAFNEGHHGQQN